MACVLVVDDDADIVEAVTMALALEGYEVAATADGEEAVELATTRSPCLMLIDYRLPGIDVRTLIERLRAVACAPIVLCTASDAAEHLGDVTGADSVLAKPFKIEQLLELASRTCSSQPTA